MDYGWFIDYLTVKKDYMMLDCKDNVINPTYKDEEFETRTWE